MSHCPHCGGVLDERKRRSLSDHRRLMAIIHQAFENWPETHDYQPETAEMLRAWLICKAGPQFRETTPILVGDEIGDVTLLRIAIEAAIRAAGGMAFVVPVSNGVAVVRPKSMSFRAMAQSEFSRLRDAIEEVIGVEMGTKLAA
jgi:hypothetical protein